MPHPYPFHTHKQPSWCEPSRIQRKARRPSLLDRSGPIILTVLATLAFGILFYLGGVVEGWWL